MTSALLTVAFTFFPLLLLLPRSWPQGSKCFSPRRLLTHRCYSNAGRKSWPNITSDPTCQLIHQHLFWNGFSTSINYPIFPPCPSMYFCLAPAIFLHQSLRSTNSDCTVAENLSPWVHERSEGSHQGHSLSLCLFPPKALWWIESPRKQKLSAKTSNFAQYISTSTYCRPPWLKTHFLTEIIWDRGVGGVGGGGGSGGKIHQKQLKQAQVEVKTGEC